MIGCPKGDADTKRGGGPSPACNRSFLLSGRGMGLRFARITDALVFGNRPRRAHLFSSAAVGYVPFPRITRRTPPSGSGMSPEKRGIR